MANTASFSADWPDRERALVCATLAGEIQLGALPNDLLKNGCPRPRLQRATTCLLPGVVLGWKWGGALPLDMQMTVLLHLRKVRRFLDECLLCDIREAVRARQDRPGWKGEASELAVIMRRGLAADNLLHRAGLTVLLDSVLDQQDLVVQQTADEANRIHAASLAEAATLLSVARRPKSLEADLDGAPAWWNPEWTSVLTYRAVRLSNALARVPTFIDRLAAMPAKFRASLRRLRRESAECGAPILLDRSGSFTVVLNPLQTVGELAAGRWCDLAFMLRIEAFRNELVQSAPAPSSNELSREAPSAASTPQLTATGGEARKTPKTWKCILEALGDNVLSGKSIAAETGYSRGHVRNVLPEMVRAGLIETTARGYRHKRDRQQF